MTSVRLSRIGIHLLAVVATGLLFGCASPPIKQAPQIESAPQGKERVYIYRDSDSGRARDVTILVDGKAAVVLGNRQYASILLEEGPHDIRTKWAFDVSIPEASHPLVATSQKVSFLRLNIAYASKGVTITGNPLVPVVAKGDFSSQFAAQNGEQAYEEMSYCSKVK